MVRLSVMGCEPVGEIAGSARLIEANHPCHPGESRDPVQRSARVPAFAGMTRLFWLRRRRDAGDAAALLADAFGDDEGQLQRLAAVEPRVAVRVVAVLQTLGGDR